MHTDKEQGAGTSFIKWQFSEGRLQIIVQLGPKVNTKWDASTQARVIKYGGDGAEDLPQWAKIKEHITVIKINH